MPSVFTVMSWIFVGIGLLLQLVSYFCCVLPIVPGPVLAYFGLLPLYLTNHRPSILSVLVATGVVVVACTLDYVVPALCAKRFKCSRGGVIGCFLGSILGFVFGTIASLFCTIFVGVVVLVLFLIIAPFFGTIVGELCADRSFKEACWGGLGSLVGNIVAVGLKLLACLMLTVISLWTLLGPS